MFPMSIETTLHYSWDYAQQVHFPHHAQQVGPIYFKTPRKCNVFGVCSERSGNYFFFLHDVIKSYFNKSHFHFETQLLLIFHTVKCI